MASRVLPGLGLSGFWGLGEDGWKDGADANWLALSALTNLTVLNTVTSLPGSPTNGDIYLISGGADANKIAVRDNGAWVYIVPKAGFRCLDAGAAVFKYYNGSAWVPELPTSNIAGLNLLSVATAASSSSFNFSGLDSTYQSYLLVLAGIRPSADVDLNLRLKDASGGSFYSGASDYQHGRTLTVGATESAPQYTSAGSAITICPTVISSASHGFSGNIWINCRTGRRASARWSGLQVVDGGSNMTRIDGAGYFRGSATTQLDGIQLLPASGTLTEGSAKLYGLKNSL